MNTDKKKIAFKTFGCKLNFSETSEISRQISTQGFDVVANTESADIYIIHSCTVTALAEKKARQTIRQFKRLNPDAKIGVIGCYAQLRGDELLQLPDVDFIAGNETKYNLAELLSDNKEHSIHSDDEAYTSYHGAFSLNDRTRSFLKVQDGCDYFCTYCAVAFARGRSRSDSIANTLVQAEKIAKSEVKEIVLTGVNVGDFGKERNETLFDLLREIEKIDGIDRIRLSSIEPNLLENRIIDMVAQSNKIMPHFHIPLQSGNNRMLSMMKRRYKRELFKEKVDYIKHLMPNACIAADVIVGFPTETEEEFSDTLNFINDLDISYLHVFTYSDRPGTKSADIKEKVPQHEKHERSKRLHALSEQKKIAFYHENEGYSSAVLFEEQHEGYIYGWTENYIRVKAPDTEVEHNEIRNIKLLNIDPADGVYLIDVNND